MSRNVQILLLVIATVAIYLPALTGDFVFDDRYLIEKNLVLHSPEALKVAFTEDYYGQANPQYALGYYRPLTIFTHWIDWQIWGNFAPGHHFTTLLIHLFVVVAVYFLVLRFFDRQMLAFLTALIFAFHPSHAHNVSCVSGRVDSLATLFVLLSLLTFTRNKLLAPVFFLAALLTKEISATLPALIFWKAKEEGLRKAFLWMIPFLIVALVVFLVRKQMIAVSPTLSSFSTPTSIARPFLLLFEYIRLLIFPPVRLFFEPPLDRLNYVIAFLGAALYAAGLIFLPDRTIASWSAIWLITLLPVIGIFHLETTIDERFLYLPSFSFALLGGAWILRYLELRKSLSWNKVLVASGFLILVYAPLILVREAYWHSDLSLWTSAAEMDPQSSKIRLRLGIAHLEAAEYQEAEKAFVQGLKLGPEDQQIASALYAHLAIVKQIQNQYGTAEQLYRKSIQITPSYYTALFNLGLLYQQQGNFEEAKQLFMQALQANKRSGQAHWHLGMVLIKTGNETEGKRHLEIATKLGYKP